jgi:hypothetical protein
MFFKAHEGPEIHLNNIGQNAIEPTNSTSGQIGRFSLITSGTNATTLYYTLSGSADNGVDYVGTNGLPLSGMVTIPAFSLETSIPIDIVPLQDSVIEFDETVTLTLIPTNSYLIEPGFGSATITISDNFPTNIFTTVATNLEGPIGIDYHPTKQALVVSDNYDLNTTLGTLTNNFALITTNGMVTNWSGIPGCGMK